MRHVDGPDTPRFSGSVGRALRAIVWDPGAEAFLFVTEDGSVLRLL